MSSFVPYPKKLALFFIRTLLSNPCQKVILVNLPKSGRDIPLTAVLRCQFLTTTVSPTLIVGLNTLKKKEDKNQKLEKQKAELDRLRKKSRGDELIPFFS